MVDVVWICQTVNGSNSLGIVGVEGGWDDRWARIARPIISVPVYIYRHRCYRHTLYIHTYICGEPSKTTQHTPKLLQQH